MTNRRVRSEQNGDLWVTYHRSGKLEGMFSIMSQCINQCEFSGMCYSKRLEKFRPDMVKKGIDNFIGLEDDKTEFISPQFPQGSIVRWFSIGSCNGSVIVMEKIKQVAITNPESIFGIWIEPQYWSTYYRELSDVKNITLIYSRKVMDSPLKVNSEGNCNSFNIMTSNNKIETFLSENNAVRCYGKCRDCEYCCYTQKGLTVLEIMRK